MLLVIIQIFIKVETQKLHKFDGYFDHNKILRRILERYAIIKEEFCLFEHNVRNFILKFIYT